MWVFGATGWLLIIVMLRVLHCICKLFSQGRERDQQVASFVGFIAVLTQNKGGRCGEPFQAWEMWLSPHSEKPVGSEVGGQDPHPWIGSPMGNQACIVPRLL